MEECAAQQNNAVVPVEIPGSRSLANKRWEIYARERAYLASKLQAARAAGFKDKTIQNLRGNASRTENRPEVQARIDFLARQEDEVHREKRRKLEADQWLIHDLNINDALEVVEVEKDGATHRYQRPKLIADMPEEVQRAIEGVHVAENGWIVPKFYSKAQAAAMLCKMNGIGANMQRDGDGDDFGRLTDAELVEAIKQQARELGRYDQLFASIGGVDESPPLSR